MSLIARVRDAQNHTEGHKHLFESLPLLFNQSDNLVGFWKIAFNGLFLLHWDMIICLFIADVIDLAVVAKAVCITQSSKSSAKISQQCKMPAIIKSGHSWSLEMHK